MRSRPSSGRRRDATPPEFLIDRSLSQVSLPAALREAGLTIRTLHRVKDQGGLTSSRGKVPNGLLDHSAVIDDYDPARLGGWIELAAIAAGHPCLKHGQKNCLRCKLRINLLGE
jgi:hypothetical protein